MGRLREQGVLVYPVHSRRSRGLSVGINLFPGRKQCSFDCPYCEVFPFSTDAVFSLERLEADLRGTLALALERDEPVMDICFSGNGEPSLSPVFPDALKLAVRIRDGMVPSSKLVIITNGTGLLEPETFAFLRDAAAGPPALDIWLKLDAGTPDWFLAINSPVPKAGAGFDGMIAKIREFAACAPVTIQTMLCAVDGREPPALEAGAWERLVVELAAANGNIRKVQIYGKARPSPDDPKAEQLPFEYLERRAASLRLAFGTRAAFPVPLVEIYP